MKPVVPFICILLTAVTPVYAHSYDTSEGIFANQLAIYAKLYSILNEGQSPSSWSDIQTCINSPIDTAYSDITPTKRYAFISTPFHLPAPYEGELLVITREPFRDVLLYTNFFGGISSRHQELGRYIIYREPDGQFRSAYVDEAYVQRAFQGFESRLPAPDS